MPGRRTKRTPALVKALCDVLAQGGTRTAACHAVGIHNDTLYDWLEKYPVFSEAVAQAEAQAELRFTRAIVVAARAGDWRAGAFWLERRRPLEYGQRTHVEGEVTLDVSEILRQHLVRKPAPLPEPDPDIYEMEPPPTSTNGHVSP